MATPNYDINYNDKRFTEVENDKKAAMNEIDVTYGNMINSADKYYQDQINAVDKYEDKQIALQNQQTDFAIEKIEQQKDQTKKDYIKEQSGAYADWQKQSNPYGANSEKMAASGLANSGYSESSLVSMYNTYQNRVAVAREVVNRALLDYDNQMTEARLKNNSILAEIAYNTLQKRLELSLQGFQYKNTLILEKANKKLEVENVHHARYQDVLKQINTEKAFEYQRAQDEIANKRAQEALDIQKAQQKLAEDKFAWDQSKEEKASSGSSSIKKSSSGSSSKKSSGSSSRKKSSSSIPANKRKTSTYSTAAKKLQNAGATTGDGGLMTETEWKRRKRSGSTRAETSYATYDDYVNSFTAWRLKNPEK